MRTHTVEQIDWRRADAAMLTQIDTYMQGHGTEQERRGWMLETTPYYPTDTEGGWEEVQRRFPLYFLAAWQVAHEIVRARRVTKSLITYYTKREQ